MVNAGRGVDMGRVKAVGMATDGYDMNLVGDAHTKVDKPVRKVGDVVPRARGVDYL